MLETGAGGECGLLFSSFQFFIELCWLGYSFLKKIVLTGTMMEAVAKVDVRKKKL